MLQSVPGVVPDSTDEKELGAVQLKGNAKLRKSLAVLAMVFHHDAEAAFMFDIADPRQTAKNGNDVLEEATRLEKCAKDANKQFLSRCIAAMM